VQARVAADSPECGGARRELAGVGPGRRFRPPSQPRAGAKRRGGSCARDRGVYGSDCASPAAGTGRGRSGRSGELAVTLLCTKGREIRRGILLTAHRGRRRAHGQRGGGSEGTRRRRRLGRRSGELGARLPRASGTNTCDSTSMSSSRRSQKSKKTSGGPILHRRRRIDGGGGNPRRRRWWNWAQLRALVCCGCKGRRRRSSTGLNRARGKKVRGGERAPGGGACH
jgi:hypothetical protein